MSKMKKYFEDVIEPEERSIREKVIIPSKSTIKGRRWDGWDRDARERTIENCMNRIVVSHTDADGFVSAALMMDYFDKVSVINIDYEDMDETFEYINKHSKDIDEVYVTDLNLDEVYSSIVELTGNVEKFVWLDHHNWGEEEDKLSFLGVDITVNQDRCAAGVVLDYLKERGYEPDEKTIETVKITEDHDLWNHEMEGVEIDGESVCISKLFSNLAFYSDDEDFMCNILDYGRDFMEHEEELLRDGKEEGFLEEKEIESREKLEFLIENQTEVKQIGDYRVAFCYGRAPPGELLERLKEKENIDIVSHSKPSYPVKVSFRSTEEFQRCHEIAEVLGGGGHEQAAACKPEIVRKPFEWFCYIAEEGEPLKEKSEEAIREIVEN